MPRVDGFGFSDALGGLLKEYHGQVIARVNEAGVSAVKELARITRRTAPKRTGDYRKHIQSGLKEERRFGNVYAWYLDDSHYRLTHLLVHGHRTRNGGHTRPNPFLQNAIDEVEAKYERDVLNAVKEQT